MKCERCGVSGFHGHVANMADMFFVTERKLAGEYFVVLCTQCLNEWSRLLMMHPIYLDLSLAEYANDAEVEIAAQQAAWSLADDWTQRNVCSGRQWRHSVAPPK